MKNEENGQSLTMENLEHHLQGQPLRPVPSQWREEILTAASKYRRDTTSQQASED